MKSKIKTILLALVGFIGITTNTKAQARAGDAADPAMGTGIYNDIPYQDLLLFKLNKSARFYIDTIFFGTDTLLFGDITKFKEAYSWGPPKRQETYSGATDASGTYTVTFSTAYTVAPNIQASVIGNTVTQSLRITAISTTGFTILVQDRFDSIGSLPTYSNVTGASVDVLITEK